MIKLSRHAEVRTSQRGVTNRQIEQILEHADIEKQIGSNCTLIRVSNRAAKSTPSLGKLSKVALIWSDTNAQFVTVFPLDRGASGRRYRSKD
jgi:hypothetical protein